MYLGSSLGPQEILRWVQTNCVLGENDQRHGPGTSGTATCMIGKKTTLL